MKLILGLGNPGAEYTHTRHNIGRRLIEAIAAKERVSFTSKRSWKAAVAPVDWSGETVHLAYPLTYMNLSGAPAKALLTHLGIQSLKDVLVVVDDVALPFGKFRLRGDGSSGGHNGLASIEESFGSRDYSRLRIGIGFKADQGPSDTAGAGGWLREYVLSTFDPEEERRMEGLLVKGVEACRSWVLQPLTASMNWVNAKEKA